MAVKFPFSMQSAQNYSPPSGATTGTNISLCNPPSVQTPPRVAMVEIQWSKYPGGAVAIDFNANAILNPIDTIKSAFVDNLGMTIPVTLFFPDTQFEVTCPANATRTALVATAQLQCIVILGATSLSLSSLTQATTRIHFANREMQTDAQLAVPQAITYYEQSNLPGTPQSFGPKPLGELRMLAQLNLSNNAITVNGTAIAAGGDIFGPFSLPRNTTSYLVITDVRAWSNDVILLPNATAGAADVTVLLQDTINNLTYEQWVMPTRNDLSSYGYTQLQESHGVYIPINPFKSTTYTLTDTLNQGTSPHIGTFNVDMNFTLINLV